MVLITSQNYSQLVVKVQKIFSKMKILSFLLVILLHWRGNIIVYTPSQGTKRENYFNQNSFEGKSANSGGK